MIAVLSKNCLKGMWRLQKERKCKRRLRRYQTHTWLAGERRRLYGHYTRLVQELRVEDLRSTIPQMKPECLNAVVML